MARLDCIEDSTALKDSQQPAVADLHRWLPTGISACRLAALNMMDGQSLSTTPTFTKKNPNTAALFAFFNAFLLINAVLAV